MFLNVRRFVTTIFLIKIILFYALINFLAQMYFLMLIIDLFLLTFIFNLFYDSSILLDYSFCCILTENLSSIFSHKEFVHLRDSNMLFFLSLQSICYHLL